MRSLWKTERGCITTEYSVRFEKAGVPNGKKLDDKLNELYSDVEKAEQEHLDDAEKYFVEKMMDEYGTTKLKWLVR